MGSRKAWLASETGEGCDLPLARYRWEHISIYKVNSALNFTAAYFREWLRDFPKEPADRMAMALAAVDACETFERSLNAAHLGPLVIAASAPHKLVFESGCRLLVQLATVHVDAQQCLLQMIRSRDASARFHAAAYIEKAVPEDLRREIVQLALSDRSVRKKGIQGAEEFKFIDLLPRLEEMQRHERSKSVQDALAFHIPILRSAFGLSQTEDGKGYYLKVLGPMASARSFIPKEQCFGEFRSGTFEEENRLVRWADQSLYVWHSLRHRDCLKLRHGQNSRINSKKEVGKVHGHDDLIFGLAVSRDGKLLVSSAGDKDPMVKIWDPGQVK
jgi:hypothetical protein